MAEGWMVESYSQWDVEGEKCFSPSLHGTFCLARACVAQHSCRCTGAHIRASSAVSWLQQAKGGWLHARVDGIPLPSQGIHRADHT